MSKQIGNIYMKRFLYFKIYLIKGEDGDILIDTGFFGMKRWLKRWLDKFNVKLIILTHAHIDHVWNASYLKELYNCKIALGQDDIENLDNSHIISKPSKGYYKIISKLVNIGTKIFRQKQFEVDIALKDDQILEECGLNLKIVSLKGHTNGSIGIIYKDYIFVGDALVNRKPYVEIAYQNQDLAAAKESALKIVNLNPSLAFVGHDGNIKREKLLKSVKHLTKN